jgi:hypothetical protein
MIQISTQNSMCKYDLRIDFLKLLDSGFKLIDAPIIEQSKQEQKTLAKAVFNSALPEIYAS